MFALVDMVIRALPLKGPRSGTLVVLVNRLGDAIVSRPLVELLRSSCEYRGPFLVLGDESWRCLSDNLYDEIPTMFIDEGRYTSSLRYRLAVNYRIRTKRFERAICFMHHRLEMRDDALIYASGAPHSVVSSLPFYHLRWYPWVFDHYIGCMSSVVESSSPYLKESDQLPPTDCDYPRRVPHVLERQRAFAAALGLKLEHEHQPIKRLRNKTVLLNFGAKAPERQWPINEWVALAAGIAELGYSPCLVGGPAERGKLRQVWKSVDALGASDTVSGRISTLVDEAAFGELREIFSEAACYIGPDTGTSHLAIHCGTPTVTILLHPELPDEEDRFGDFFPYPNGYLRSPYRCVCATKAEFNRTGSGATLRNTVLAAFTSIMDEIEANSVQRLAPAS